MCRSGSRGQVLVIFAGAAFLLMALMALVIDVSWYWANTIRVQRAADAAALAGAVMLPGQPDCVTGACFVARQEAKKDGYNYADPNVTVTPTQDTTDPRQLDVTVSAQVPTFFMRIIGIQSITATRSSKGLYVLPVPMGSPLAYYGVGDYYDIAGMSTSTPTNYTSVPTSGSWGTPGNASSSSSYSTSNPAKPPSTNTQAQVWSNLHILPAITSTTISGIVVSFNAYVSTAASACQVQARVSFTKSGTSWGSLSQTSVNLTNNGTTYNLGGSSDPTVWDSSHKSWTGADFIDGTFQVQLTYLRGSGCGTLYLNNLDVTVFEHPTTKDPSSSVLPSQGGWGAIITRGGNEQNGDAYAPANNGGDTGSDGKANGPYPNTPYVANSLYNGSGPNGGGYIYAVNLPAGGKVYVFDPGFCAMGSNPSGAGSLGAGDHWIGTSGTTVSTYYTLWDTHKLLGLSPASWTQLYTSGSLFQDQTGYDSLNAGPAGAPSGASLGCDAYHNAWWPVPYTLTTGGTYALQVSTTNPNDATKNQTTNAENMFAIEAIGGGSPTVYGNGKMAVYNNLQPGNASQQFYLAKIDQNTGAGKTALIDIFDIGDVNGTAVLKVLSPDNKTQTPVTFSYTTDGNCDKTIDYYNTTHTDVPYSDACSANNVTQIQSSLNTHSSFNNTWIHIVVNIPGTYGANGLWAPPGADPGWWQIQYQTPGGGNDTTTWQTSLVGNPVHLVVP